MWDILKRAEGILRTPLHSEAASPLPPGDILALVFGLLFAVTSVAFLVQMRRQQR